MQEPRRYSSAAAESILSLKLTKGRYLLTISCIVKAHNQWFYIYFKNQPMWTHGGYYLPATEQNMSFLVRKVYEATSEDEVVDISTISASSYQVTLSNVIITARKLVEQK